MFRKSFGFRKKSRDESLQPGSQRPASRSHSPSSSVSGASVPDDGYSTTPLSQLTQVTTSSHSLHPQKGNENSQHSTEPDSGPLGLNVVYTPENGHKADIVFVHGLGGTSRFTWSKNKDPQLFWPLTFLPLEPDICLARILTFGYDANFRAARNASATVLDFAKDLLFDLKFGKDEYKEELNMGSVPLIFVVHSMGGLIIKEAYMQGQNDPEYESIIRAISAITFLATPHRGTNLAETLNHILQSTFINSKKYISELAKNSFTLQKLNEQFRHIAPRLDIVSFYETQPTSVGLKTKVMVLEKDSSVLGYPGETSKPLNADHHGVCKYYGPKDPNYITVRNVLKSLMSKIISTSRSRRTNLLTRRESTDLKSLLAITELPDVDYIFFRDQWVQGTSDWILEDESYQGWLHGGESAPHVVWLNGGAATGKSVISSFIINDLIEQGLCCQYFFIRFGDQKKRALNSLLRSIAYQVAQTSSGFLEKIFELGGEAMDLENADPRTIWERIFKSILFKMDEQEPLYWIIDGLDEADDPRAIIRLLSDISLSSVPIRVLLISRKTSEITTAFERVPETLNMRSISIEGRLEDLRRYIRQRLNMRGTAEYKESIVDRVVGGAQNNFLWVRLAVEKLNLCHTESAVELALQQLPPGMEALYDRMALSVAQNPSQVDRALASTILQCVTCSLRVLTVAELSQALEEDTSKLLDFQQSIVDLCGGFVVIDNSGNVSMIHQTAREYLLGRNDRPFKVDRKDANRQMFLSCMRCLTTTGLRAKVNRNQSPEFLDYAARFWSSHIVSAPIDCIKVVEALNRFLTGQWVLVWIHVLSSMKQLRILVQASKHLSRYSARRKEYEASRNEEDNYIVERELVENWAIDFVKIVGKFGANLRRDPESIYKTIPPFCPKSSSIYQLFGKKEAKSLMVSGLSTENWDDSITRISLGFNVFASSILAAGTQIAILASSGSVFIFDASTFEESSASPIKHGERVYRMEINGSGTILATYGYRTTKIWDIATGKCKVTADNIESRPTPLAMLLAKNSSTLLLGSEDRRVRSLDLTQPSPTWQLVAELDEPELEGHFLNGANYMALSDDGSLIAVAYRGHPLSAWEIDGPEHIGHCWRKDREGVARGEVIEAVWLPHSHTVLGLYIEGFVFKWSPNTGELDEIEARASRLAISRDGNLFATGDVRGTVKVFTTSDFHVIYQLASQDTVFGVAFSPDLCRFYDIRGYYGNAWEPNALMKFAATTGKSADDESEAGSLAPSSTASVNWTGRVESISVLAYSPLGRLYCYGTERGAVHLYDTQRGHLAELHKSKGLMGIKQLSWSGDGKFVSFADAGKTISIMPISSNSGNLDPTVETKGQIPMKNSTRGPILQLLFEPHSIRLLVHTDSKLHTISLESSSVIQSVDLETSEYKWIIHPRDPTLIMGIGSNTIQIVDWDLNKRQSYRLEYLFNQNLSSNTENSSSHYKVEQALVTHDKKHVLVQLSLLNQNSKEKQFLYFDTPSLSPPITETPESNGDTNPVIITCLLLPQNLTSQIALPLCFLSQYRLVFVSRTFSICSLKLPPNLNSHLPSVLITSPSSTPTAETNSAKHLHHQRNEGDDVVDKSIKPIFALPGDWISRDCLALCSIWTKERSLLCPRNGELAVVYCAALI
ncbi:NACHT and WD domain protein [Xylogone sp. PMI_703]|nr:NACHT and WD domain protein [Xylogone sp. PMI_703]